MIKKLGILIVLAFIGIQFFRPAKNESNDNRYHINTQYAMPNNVATIMQAACYDCHSNQTRYHWYFQVQPVAWFLSNHVNEGKQHVNYAAFTNLPLAVQYHKLEETIEMVEKKEMPMGVYTAMGLHSKAKLSDAQRQDIINWAANIRATMEANYPADSLIRKSKKKSS